MRSTTSGEAVRSSAAQSAQETRSARKTRSAQETQSAQSEIRMPPGPSLPPIVQTLYLVRKMVWFLQRCQQRYGDCFTVRAVRGERLVCVAHPDLILQVFTCDPTTYHGGEHNAALGIGAVLGSGSLGLVQKSSRWFPDSETYRPERFLQHRPDP